MTNKSTKKKKKKKKKKKACDVFDILATDVGFVHDVRHRLMGTKWQHSWSCFCFFQTSISNSTIFFFFLNINKLLFIMIHIFTFYYLAVIEKLNAIKTKKKTKKERTALGFVPIERTERIIERKAREEE